MELRVITLENGMKLVGSADKPAPTPEQSAFAAELERVAEAAKQAEASGSTKLQAAWSSLTPSSKEVLERMKSEEPNITEEEWDRLKRELAAMGLISGDDLMRTTNNAVVGKVDMDQVEDWDCLMLGSGSVTLIGTYDEYMALRSSGILTFDIEWTGDPLKYMDMWLQALRRQMDGFPGRAEQVESYEKLYNVLSQLLETAGGL